MISYLRVLLALGAAVMVDAIRLHNDPIPKAKAMVQHYWPHPRGQEAEQSGRTNVIAPRELSPALAWTWHHPKGRYHTVLAGGPVVDRDMYIFQAANDGVRKLNQYGRVLWHYQPSGFLNNQVALDGGAIYGLDTSGHAWAVCKNSGVQLWLTRLAGNAGGDCGYPAVHNGVFVVGADQGHDLRMDGGNKLVFGLNASTGKVLWQYKTEYPVWNLMPLFPDADNTVFMDFTGGMYRLDLHTGRRHWHTPVPDSAGSFSDGGAGLGPNGVAYSCSNLGGDRGFEGERGAVRAFALGSGEVLWEQRLPQPCNSYPAISPLGAGRGLSVVVTPGSFPGQPSLHGSVVALDAATGAVQWQYQAPLYTNWPFGLAKGDIEGYIDRFKVNPKKAQCLPAHWSAPTVDGNGTVYAARTDGKLYALRPPPGPVVAKSPASALQDANFSSTPGVEVDVFDADGASLHGAMAWAPGMMALSTCDTLYVFRF